MNVGSHGPEYLQVTSLYQQLYILVLSVGICEDDSSSALLLPASLVPILFLKCAEICNFSRAVHKFARTTSLQCDEQNNPSESINTQNGSKAPALARDKISQEKRDYIRYRTLSGKQN